MAIEKLGDILLLERLAAGGMAEVFRGRQYGHSGFEKTVAVKRILPSHSSSEEFKAMFRQEANLSAQLQHPNIAQVFSNGSHGDYFYIVMELVEGKNLRQLFLKTDAQQKKVPIEFACYVMCEAAKGLEYAHSFVDEKSGEHLRIVHRDVNHQNVMMSYDGAIKIVDFGVAKAADQDGHKTKAGVLKGKIAYMSPEQVRGRHIDRRTDIFSLGIVMWELLAGRALFMDDDEFKTLDNVRRCVVPELSGENSAVPAALEQIINKALQKDVDLRYATAKEFYTDLQRFLNEHYPKFIQDDVALYLKDLFKEEIANEKVRKEKINQEAKAFLLKNPILRPGKNRIFGDDLSAAGRTVVQVNPLAEDLTVVGLPSQSGVQKPPTNPSQLNVLDKSAGAWHPSLSNVVAPKFEYDHTGANSQVYSSAVQAHSGKLVMLLLVIVGGLMYTWFSEREKLLFASYDSSRFEKWTPTFKENFLQACISTVRVAPSETYKLQLCECMSPTVEGAHILKPKFNPNVTTEERLAAENLTEIENFWQSARGQTARADCHRRLASTLEE